jgi:hypothetical protein
VNGRIAGAAAGFAVATGMWLSFRSGLWRQ